MENHIKEILVKYITGHASDEEKRLAKQWIAENEAQEKAFVALYENWHKLLAQQHDVIDANKAYDRFIFENTSKKSSYTWLKYAATILLVSAMAFTAYVYQQKNIKTAYQELVVPRGKTQKITLPDGTLVIINAGTKLSYNKDFGKTERQVILNGEAFFDIAESENKIPFIIEAAGFTVRDIGTAFTVKAYPEDGVFETAVKEGKVSVEGKLNPNDGEDGKVFINANQLLKIDFKKTSKLNPSTHKKNNTPLSITDVKPAYLEEYNGWQHQLLMFENTSFLEIINTLERRFNVEIVLEDPELGNYHYTGTFKPTADVFTVLQIIKETTPITYMLQEKRIIVKNTNQLYHQKPKP
jgi:ferric-dicitrate binding protein FerR (iron transport regulator)